MFRQTESDQESKAPFLGHQVEKRLCLRLFGLCFPVCYGLKSSCPDCDRSLLALFALDAQVNFLQD